MMEVLAGTGDEAHARKLRRLLGRCEFLATSGPADYEQSATLYRPAGAVGRQCAR